MKVAFDVDGVVLNSIEIILNHINQTTGTTLGPDDLFAWDLDTIGIDEEMLRESVRYMYAQPMIEAYEGAVEALSRIYRATGEPLLFITGRASLESARMQLEALQWNAHPPEMIVMGGDRYKTPYFEETSTEFIIEDDPEHLQAYLDQGMGVGLMLQPWNRSSTIPVTERFEGWKDLERWFMGSVLRSRAGA
jgi:phosphoglycolate phosphatase-like HAD superfamily hydrolase